MAREIETLRVRVDGFFRHNRQLTVEDPSQAGRFITAEVSDPAFDKAPNIYTEAASRGDWLTVRAKETRKRGKLVKLRILPAPTSPDKQAPGEG